MVYATIRYEKGFFLCCFIDDQHKKNSELFCIFGRNVLFHGTFTDKNMLIMDENCSVAGPARGLSWAGAASRNVHRNLCISESAGTDRISGLLLLCMRYVIYG
jgi:hypothetical protein